MNEQLNQELETITEQIQEYVNGPILPDPEDFNANKAVKLKLKTFIEKVAEDNTISKGEKEALITKTIIILASNTGHHEDLDIADEILDELYDRKYITDKDITTFNENTGTSRME